MATINDLQHDHASLREALMHLRDALQEAETPDRIRARVGVLTALLDEHMRRERAVCAAECGVDDPLARRGPCPHDTVEPEVLLRDLQALLAIWGRHPVGPLTMHVLHLLDELRQQLDEEERELFPRLRRAEARTADEVWLQELGAA